MNETPDKSIADIVAAGITFELIRLLLKPTKEKQGHWISGGESDQSEDFCFECAKEKVDALNRDNSNGDYLVDGGWENHDSDSVVHCEKCECLLNFWPTDHCFETELEGFESCGVTCLGNENRYIFDILLCGASDQNEDIRNRLLKLCWRFLWESANETKLT